MASKKKEKETTQTPKLDRVESEVSLNDTGGSGWHCVVCCQKVPGPSRRELYAIGHCDHVVCYECSTKMRVLCQQNECPICRQDIPKVVFTPNKSLKFAAIDMNKFTVVNKAHQIHFESESAERAYSTLLEHRCKLCRKESGSLKELDTHLRREHELYLCELCTDNLKVFTHERKYYNRKDLARHRRNGDPEDTSHRGHPLCQFCDVRYMDDESLHLHLRRDHYYCHFCDPLGLKQFYDTYDHLRDHFKHEHYLCEEGPCRDEKFTTVFKSDIDLQAHRVEVHCVTKTDAKQARILSLDFSYKPRSGAVGGQGAPTASIHHQPFRQFPGQRKTKPPVVDDVDSDSEPLLAANAMQEVPRAEDFPSLGPAQKASATVVARPRNYAMSSAGPKPEDFPSLPSAPLPSSASSSKMRQTQSYASNAHKSKDLVQNRKVKPQTREPGFTARPAGPSGPSGRRPDDDFPSLPNYMPPSHVPSIRAKELKQFGGSSLASSIADNTLVKPTSKIATVTSLDNFGAGSQQQGKPSSSSKANFMTDEFPSLPVNEKKSKKKKKPIAEATPVNSSKGSSQLVKNVKSSPEKLTLASLAASTVAVGTNNKGKESASQNNNGRNKKEDHNIRKEEPTKLPLETDNKLDYPGLVSTEKPKKPKAAPPGLTTAAKKSPPGFGPTENGLGKAPPGFPNGSKKPAPKPPSSGQATNSASLSTVAQQILTTSNGSHDVNGNTSSSDNATANNVFGCRIFVEPPSFEKRNQSLVHEITDMLRDGARFSAFKKISQEFRHDTQPADSYYKRCIELFGKNNFHRLFGELIVLLPDVRKQNELLAAHEKYVKYSKGAIPKKSNHNGGSTGVWIVGDETMGQHLVVCPSCQQVLAQKDGAEHMSNH